MSRLSYAGRPWVAFDAANKDHRRWYHEFIKKGSWGATPVRFIVPNEDGDLLTLCQRKLIQHYVNREFGKIAS